jgi:hypothetical protein
VIAAACPLALGISGDVYVVFLEVSASVRLSALAALFSMFVLLGLWFAYPVWVRSAQMPSLRGNHG